MSSPNPNKQRDDFLSGLRRCVQTAPPGQLQAIVKQLHILISKTGDEEQKKTKKNSKKEQDPTAKPTKPAITPKIKTTWFFQFINKIVFEHICSNLFLSAEIPFGSESGGFAAISADASIVKIGKVADPNFVPTFLKESLDDDIVQNREGGLHVVLDWQRRRLHVVDPILLEVLRSCSFKEVLPTFKQPVEDYRKWIEELELDQENDFAFTPLFDKLVTEQKLLNEDKNFRNLLALHDVLSRSWQVNSSSRFVDAATSRTGTNIILVGGGEEDKSEFPFGLSFTLHSQRINSDAFWSARWKSRWTLTKKKENQIWTLEGTIGIEYHSGEEGNVQMTGSDTFTLPLTHQTSIASSEGASLSQLIDKWIFNTNKENAHGEVGATLFAPFVPPMAAHTTNKTIASLVDLARAIVKTMEKGEDAVQQKIETACGPLRSEAAVKALRRKMPLNNRLVEFSMTPDASSAQQSKRMIGAGDQQQDAEREAQFQ